MENKNQYFGLMLIGILLLWITYMMLDKPLVIYNEPKTNCKEDSLQQVIYQLQSQIKNDEDGWDKKEQRYEDILFEYEYGINRLKETHPEAYREFHRIIGFKEIYSRETERENKLRLKSSKW